MKLLIILLSLLTPAVFNAQVAITAPDKLPGRWVQYSEPSADTIVYIPYQSPLAEGLLPYIRHGGITFEPDNICLHHHWQKCGNETGPDYYEGSWSMENNADVVILTITYYQDQSQHFIVHKLNEHVLVMTRKQ